MQMNRDVLHTVYCIIQATVHLVDGKRLLDHGIIWVTILVLKCDECKGRNV